MITGKVEASQENEWMASHIVAALQKVGVQKM